MKAMSLTQEISRLYRKGKTPPPYKSTNVTEMAMMLYLSNKHNINNPVEQKIRQQYKIYGRNIHRLRPSKTAPPMFNSWELELYYDDKDRLVRTNRDDYYSVFYWKLHDLIEANPGKKVTCTFDISMYKNNVPDNGHTEIIVYDPALNILEHTDSNNQPKQCARHDCGYFACSEVVTSIMRDIVKVLPQKPLFINNEDIYSRYDWGIQCMESGSDLLTEMEKSGYCLAWATLFGDFALSFPEYSMKQIIEEMIKKAKSPLNSATYMNDYLLFVIRGYVADLSQKLDVRFDDETSQHEACIRLAFTFEKQI